MVSGVSMGRKELLPNGIEVVTVRLFEQAATYFGEKVRNKEARSYLAGLYGWSRAAIRDIKPIKHEDDCLELEVFVANPGECIVDFFLDHWSCGDGIALMSWEENVKFICIRCKSELDIRKELLEATR